MNLDTINRIRDAIRRCDRREIDALTALYRIDNVLGEIDGQYELEFSSTCDASMRQLFPGEEDPSADVRSA